MTSSADPDKLLAEFRHRYSDALGVLGAVQATSEPDEWPDWCWLPMDAAAGYVRGRAGQAPDVGRVAALTAWRLQRGHYRIDPVVAERTLVELAELGEAGDGGADGDGGATGEGVTGGWADAPTPAVQELVLREWCPYLELPPAPAGLQGVRWPLGCWVHLESDADTGQPELRLLLDRDGSWEGLTSVPVYLDRATLGDATVELVEALGPDAGDAAQPARIAAYALLCLVLALCDPKAVIHAPGQPDVSPERGSSRAGRWWPVKETRSWLVQPSERPSARLLTTRH